MKKVLLLGIFAFFAINLVAVQNVNAQVKKANKAIEQSERTTSNISNPTTNSTTTTNSTERTNVTVTPNQGHTNNPNVSHPTNEMSPVVPEKKEVERPKQDNPER